MTWRSNTLKNSLMLGTIIVALLVSVAWSYHRLSESRASAASAADERADCGALVARIAALRHRPSLAGAQELGEADLSRRIERAGADAQFSHGTIERVAPEAPRRIGESNYLEVAVQVPLHRVTLQQVFTFLHVLAAPAPHTRSEPAHASGFGLRSIRLIAPRGEEAGDRWMVEPTLTYIVYSPKGSDAAVAGEPQAKR